MISFSDLYFKISVLQSFQKGIFMIWLFFFLYSLPDITGRTFKKIELSESIRYASADPIESWLNDLLCLDVTKSIPALTRSTQLAVLTLS